MSDRILTFEPGTSLVWNASLRSLHSALLLTGGPDLAREFWLGHPLESRGAPLTGAELFEYVWEERSLTPLDYQLRVLDSVEAFCLHRDMDFVPFVRERVFQRQRGTVLSARGSLVLAGRILLQLVRTRDLHHTILEVLDTSLKVVAPSILTRLIHHARSEEGSEGWVLQVHDRDFTGRYPGYDAEIWLGLQLEQSPERLGAAPFEDVECVCEVRGVQQVLEAVPRGLHPVRREDGWILEGRPISRAVSFRDWLRSRGLDPGALREVPDHPVQEVLEDVECPARRRKVLKRGAVYGSLCYILRLRWSDKPSRPVEEGLAQLIQEAMSGGVDSPGDKAAERQEELLGQFRRKLSFVFHRQDATMSCNGEHLLRGVPAKILQKVLMAHTLTGRTIFEHREFRRDPDLGLDPLNPNLESRIRILSDRLENRLDGIRIVKDEKGRFGLEAKSLVEFTEE